MTTENTEKTSLVDAKTNLMNSDEFNQALDDAANLKKEMLTSLKSRNRNNYERFFDVMLTTNPKIQELLDKPKRKRTDDENNRIKDFKKEISQTYKQVCDLLVPEDLEEGEQTKVQKMVRKITTVLKMLDYLGNNAIEEEFKAAGIELKYRHLKEEEVYQNVNIRKNVEDIFHIGKDIKEESNKSADDIKTTIYTQSVPVDLQYDKNNNPVGIKSSDFTKLVDLRTKLLMAETEEAKEKVGEAAENIASDYVFQNNRNDIMNKKILEMIPEE